MKTRILGILCCCFAALLIGGGPFVEHVWSEEPLTQGDVAEPVAEKPATEDAPANETRGTGCREFAPKRVPKYEVKFPSASEAKPLTERPPALTVDVAEDGTLTVAGQIVSHQELDEMLRQYARNHPGQGSVVIRAL